MKLLFVISGLNESANVTNDD